MRSALMPRNNAPDASAEAALNLGLEHLRRNHLSLAAEAFREGLRRSPDHPLILSYYGLCLARLETNYAEALRFCKRAAQHDPYDPTLLVNLGKVYRLIGDRGAGPLLEGVRLLDPPPGMLSDVDTPEDLAEVERQLFAR